MTNGTNQLARELLNGFKKGPSLVGCIFAAPFIGVEPFGKLLNEIPLRIEGDYDYESRRGTGLEGLAYGVVSTTIGLSGGSALLFNYLLRLIE